MFTVVSRQAYVTSPTYVACETTPLSAPCTPSYTPLVFTEVRLSQFKCRDATPQSKSRILWMCNIITEKSIALLPIKIDIRRISKKCEECIEII